VLSPGEFIPLAEETGLIEPIGAWVLIEACRQLAQWREAGKVADDFTVSVNLSVRQLARPDLSQTVTDALARTRVPAPSLCLEVTETCMAQDPERAAQALTQLRELDVRLALDDFGTGYSSLSALSSYPLDVVKIDRSFIVRAGEDASAARMFAAVLGVARAAELGAVAEGVEEMPQLNLLRRLGCDFVQGFIFARPLTPAALISLLHTPSGVTRPAA
jgi:EAL domain-containing protein (putative c-di-GMP-specific phosphodiesterase class I)